MAQHFNHFQVSEHYYYQLDMFAVIAFWEPRFSAHLTLPMLIRSEGVGLRLQNRREKGKTKSKEQKCILFPTMLSKTICLGGGQGVQ